MLVVVLYDAIPGGLNVVVVNLYAVLLERQQVSSIVVIENPALPQFSVRFAVLVAIFGAILDKGPDRGIDYRVVLPKRVANIALQ